MQLLNGGHFLFLNWEGGFSVEPRAFLTRHAVLTVAVLKPSLSSLKPSIRPQAVAVTQALDSSPHCLSLHRPPAPRRTRRPTRWSASRSRSSGMAGAAGDPSRLSWICSLGEPTVLIISVPRKKVSILSFQHFFHCHHTFSRFS